MADFAGGDIQCYVEADSEARKTALGRAVAVYGLINVRTDGRKVLLAQKLARPDGRGRKWDVHPLEPKDGELVYVAD